MNPNLPPRAAELIRTLSLAPHPEGGFFREIHRSQLRVQPLDGRPHRAALTTIYFLLVEGQASRWHAVASDEVWHFYEGDAIELLVGSPDFATLETVRLGAVGDVLRATHTVPARWWQAARPFGRYALAGCTVGPGFEFEDFRFLANDPAALARLRSRSANLVPLA